MKSFLKQLSFIIKYIISNKNKCNTDSLKKNHKRFIKKVKSERHNVITEKIIKIALSSKDDQRMQLIDLTETYSYRTRKDLVTTKEEVKYSTIVKQCKND